MYSTYHEPRGKEETDLRKESENGPRKSQSGGSTHRLGVHDFHRLNPGLRRRPEVTCGGTV